MPIFKNVTLDCSAAACMPFGLFHSQRVRSARFSSWGSGTVIGVERASGYLWILWDGDVGVTFRHDNWRRALLEVVRRPSTIGVASSASSTPIEFESHQIDDDLDNEEEEDDDDEYEDEEGGGAR